MVAVDVMIEAGLLPHAKGDRSGHGSYATNGGGVGIMAFCALEVVLLARFAVPMTEGFAMHAFLPVAVGWAVALGA